ncbi:WhiB family transcriptional regulator [Mycobacterium montefiorense]|nr:WhiB family transcriptional regulator [Mycobacterium montefiorense]MCV7426640.1 WhiB family transcriptional regulator [Mycobacterium montefiorense]
MVPDAPVAFEPEPLPLPESELTPDQWQDRALCAQTDPEAFFPEKGGSTREAKKICLGCEVRHECLEYALAHDERFGIWGGLSERERRRLKRGII